MAFAKFTSLIPALVSVSVVVLNPLSMTLSVKWSANAHALHNPCCKLVVADVPSPKTLILPPVVLPLKLFTLSFPLAYVTNFTLRARDGKGQQKQHKSSITAAMAANAAAVAGATATAAAAAGAARGACAGAPRAPKGSNSNSSSSSNSSNSKQQQQTLPILIQPQKLTSPT